MVLNGRFITLYIEKNGEYIATACDRSATLHLEMEFLEVTDPNGGKNRRRLPGLQDWTVSGDGLVDYNRMVSALYMQQSLLGGTRIQIRYFVQNGDGYAVYEGSGYFQMVDEVGAYNNAVTYSYVIVSDSDLTIVSTIPQDSEEGKLLTVLLGNDGNLMIDSNENLIIA